MWDWRQLRWLNYVGWWPRASKTKLGYKLSRTVGIILFLSDFIQVGPEFISLFTEISSGSLALIIPNLTTTVMGVFCALKISKILLNEDNICDIIRRLEEMDERARMVLDTNIIESHTKKRTTVCEISTYLLLIDLVSIFSWSWRPLYLAYHGEKELIITSWIPWAWDATWLSWFVVYVMQSVHVSTAIYGICIYDVLAYCLFEMWLLQVDFLKEAFSNLDFTPPSVDSSGKVTLRFCVRFHQEIRLVMRKINDFVKHAILFQSVFATLVICLTMFESSSVGHTPLIKKINLYQLLAFMVYMVLFYSLICQDMESANDEIFRATFNNNWYIGTIKDQKSILMITEQCKVKDYFGYIVHSNLETFIAIIKTSFTYFNFLKAVSLE